MDSQITVVQLAFQSDKPFVFPCFPFNVLVGPSFCSLAAPAEGRQGKGEELYITADNLESSGHVKASLLVY